MESETIVSQPNARSVPAPTRFIGIDILKILAAFFVVTIHFFLYSGFYADPITDKTDLILIFVRWLSYTCVPLFMIITGYLMKNKTLSEKYYLSIVKVLVVYVIISVICAVFDHSHFNKQFTVLFFIGETLNFTCAKYAWYVEYYVCLFLIIPFLNLAFNGLKTQKQRFVLFATVFATSVLSTSFFFGFQINGQFQLFPHYFNNVYPIAYYFIGCYIRTYPPRRTAKNKLLFLAGLLVSLAFLTITSYVQTQNNNNGIFYSRHFNDYSSYPVFLAAMFLFLLLFDIPARNRVLSKVLKAISGATFACYLISYIFDSIFYAKLANDFPVIADRFTKAPLMIGKIFFCSITAGFAIQSFYDLCESAVLCIRAKRNAPKPPTGADTECAQDTLPENASTDSTQPAVISADTH